MLVMILRREWVVSVAGIFTPAVFTPVDAGIRDNRSRVVELIEVGVGAVVEIR